MIMEDKKSILHELYVFSEWKPEQEYLQKPDNILPESISSLWRWLKFFGPKKSLIDSVTAFKERQQKWHMALGDEGKVIAILTDNILEIRTKRSDYATIAARTTVSRDPYARWRKLVWSPDCSFLALAYGNGVVSFFDLSASSLYNIPTDCNRPGGLECSDNTHAVADIIFMPLRVKDNKWNWEVLIVTFDGKLRGYMISQGEFKLHHTFRFTEGVSAVAHSHIHGVLYVATVPVSKDPSHALGAGIQAWRIISDEPRYTISVASGNALDAKVYVPFLARNLAFVVRMVLSKDKSKLICLHCNGDVSSWHLPTLKLLYRWPLASQPQCDLKNPLVKTETKDLVAYQPADVNWWTDEEIILSRFSGAVSVCDIQDMMNILGKKPEFFQGAPRVTCAYDGTFMVLECESTQLPAKRSRSEDSMEVVEVEPSTEDTLLETTKEMVKYVLYAFTDIEAFQPKPKKITVVSRVYRLLGVKSTTPSQLFSRKIESGNYTEALNLASTFNLDSDLVYQQQWRKTAVSSEAIDKYLSKVSKKIWVVHQCVDRLPESLSAAKELLQFGLKLTNTQILEEINQDRPKEEHKTLDDITLEDLNASTSELLRCRHVMLFYSERLRLYEAILKCEKSTYVKEEYHRLRSHSIVHSAMEIALEARIEALTCLWPYITAVLEQLAVLENIPETIDPSEYQDLLLRVIDGDEIERSVPIRRSSGEDSDWCRKAIFRSIWHSNWSADGTPTNEAPAGSIKENDPRILTKWYPARAREIEERTGLVSNAISLLEIAQNVCGVSHLETIIDHFKTLEVLIYEVNAEFVTLKQIEQLNDLETCKLLMIKSTPATYVADLKKYVMPYLKRSQDRRKMPGYSQKALIDFVAHESVNDLSNIYLVLNSPEFRIDVRLHLELAEKCILAHQNTYQLDLACDMLGNILKETDGSISNEELIRRIKKLERLVSASSKISWKGIAVPPKELDLIQDNYRHAFNLLTRFARSLGTMDITPTQQEWESLLADILDLQDTLFSCISQEECHEIYASALLTSGDAACIKMAADVLTCQASGQNKSLNNRNLVCYKRSKELVLSAAKEYFNSASSFTDPALELARNCLLLIRDDDAEILLELDLIAALHLLGSFGLKILPIQVRLWDKINMIEECIKSDANAFMASHKLLKLAKLLRIAGDDEQTREGQVLQLIGEYAIAAGPPGYASAADAARRLASLRHAPAAGLMAHVAKNAKAHVDNDTRKQLLGAAVTFCKGEDIESMLNARLGVELESLERMGGALKHQLDERAYSAEEEFADAVTTPIIEKKDLVAHAEKKPLLYYLLDTLQNKFSASDKIGEISAPVNRSVHCQEFYHTLYPEHKTSEQYYRYNTFALPSASTNRGQQALKWFYLQNGVEDANNDELEVEVITKCAEDTIYSDTPFSVSCLLISLQNALQAKRLLDNHHTDTAVCATLYATLMKCNTHLRDDVYRTAPVKMAKSTIAENTAPSELMEIISKCLNKLSGMGEADNLKAAGFTVNAIIFNADSDYRTQTIYRVARSQNPEHLELACSLATKYNLDPLDMWLEHFIHAENMTQLNIATLPNKDQSVYTRIKDALWPVIRGDDHNSLISYFTLLKNIDEKPLISGLTATEHIKLLKKAKAASSELDYKLLLSQPSLEEFSSHILHITKPENVGMLTKFLRTLPPAFKIPMSVNTIYTQWLTKYFFSVPPAAASNKKWMQQYRQCASYFNKLSKDDLLEFLNNTCFSSDAIQRVPFQTRNLMIMQAVDYCQQEQENDFKVNKNEQSWAQVGQELTRWARFLENYHSDAIQAIIDNSGVTRDEIWPELEASHGDTGKIISSCAQLVLRDIKPQALNTLLQCVNTDATPATVLKHVADTQGDPQTIQTLVSRITQYHKEGIKLPEDLIDRLMQKASDLNLSPHKQITLLSLSNRAPIQDTGDLIKMAAFTVELLRSEFEGDEFVEDLTEETLLSESARRGVLTQVMQVANTWQRKKALVDVLLCWPPHREGDNKSLHCKYFQHLLESSSDQKESTILIKLVLRRSVLNEEEVNYLADIAPNVAAAVNALWITVLSKCGTFHDTILKLMNKHRESFQNHPLDDDLVKELLDAGMFVKLVPTAVYGCIVNYIISQEVQGYDTPYTVAWATSELITCSLLAEAGQLQLLSLGVPPALRGFTQSVLYFKNKFM